MVQVELKNMYMNIDANKGSEKLWTKNKTPRHPPLYLTQYKQFQQKEPESNRQNFAVPNYMN